MPHMHATTNRLIVVLLLLLVLILLNLIVLLWNFRGLLRRMLSYIKTHYVHADYQQDVSKISQKRLKILS